MAISTRLVILIKILYFMRSKKLFLSEEYIISFYSTSIGYKNVIFAIIMD